MSRYSRDLNAHGERFASRLSQARNNYLPRGFDVESLGILERKSVSFTGALFREVRAYRQFSILRTVFIFINAVSNFRATTLQNFASIRGIRALAACASTPNDLGPGYPVTGLSNRERLPRRAGIYFSELVGRVSPGAETKAQNASFALLLFPPPVLFPFGTYLRAVHGSVSRYNQLLLSHTRA